MSISIKKLIFWGAGLLLALLLPLAVMWFLQIEWSKPAFDYQDLRIHVIQKLIEKGFGRFVTMPLGPGSNFLHLSWSQTYPEYPEYYMTTWIILRDDLDVFLEEKLQNHAIGRDDVIMFVSKYIFLNESELNQLQKVYLFKNEQDLKDLWYVVSSYRTRINNDAAWRKDNIFISYRNIGNVRVLNPQQTFSFMDEIHYDPMIKDHKRDLVSGLAIMWGVSSVKGWGICWASRGINTAIITNRAFDIITRYNHTRTWKYLYDNTINGKQSQIPGLDVAVYRMWGSQKDFVFQNIREYPVILVMNYDGTAGGQEELFVLSKAEDRWYLKYIGNTGNCYTREANSKQFTSCYRSVSR